MTRLREDIRHFTFWRSMLAEFIGSAFLVLIGCGAWTQSANQDHPDAVKIALAFGFTYTVVVYCFKTLGDCHISSSVTVALLATRRCSVVKALLYLLCQLFGAILGACFVFGVTSYEQRNMTSHRIGCTVPAENVPESHAFGVEFFATFFLVFVVFACYEKRPPEETSIPEPVAPLLIGITYAAVTLFAVPYSGASMNPSRSFGPALIGGVWTKHWIYWFGPIFGGILGAALHELIFSAKASFERLKTCLLVFHRGESSGAANRAAQGGLDGEEHVESGLKHRPQFYKPVSTIPPINGSRGHHQKGNSRSPPLPPPPKMTPPLSPTCALVTEIQTHFHDPGQEEGPIGPREQEAKELQGDTSSAQPPCQCSVPY